MILIFRIKFERIISSAIQIIDSLLNIQDSNIIRSRDRSSETKNRRRKNLHTDTKVENVVITAREQAFENFTLRESSQIERVQMKMITIHDEAMNSKTELAVHRVNSVSDRERERERDRERDRDRDRDRRERGQAVSE